MNYNLLKDLGTLALQGYRGKYTVVIDDGDGGELTVQGRSLQAAKNIRAAILELYPNVTVDII